MHTESFIAGKDASLESSISAMQSRLAAWVSILKSAHG